MAIYAWLKSHHLHIKQASECCPRCITHNSFQSFVAVARKWQRCWLIICFPLGWLVWSFLCAIEAPLFLRRERTGLSWGLSALACKICSHQGYILRRMKAAQLQRLSLSHPCMFRHFCSTTFWFQNFRIINSLSLSRAVSRMKFSISRYWNVYTASRH